MYGQRSTSVEPTDFVRVMEADEISFLHADPIPCIHSYRLHSSVSGWQKVPSHQTVVIPRSLLLTPDGGEYFRTWSQSVICPRVYLTCTGKGGVNEQVGHCVGRRQEFVVAR